MFCFIDTSEDFSCANDCAMSDDLCYEHGTLMDITDSLKVLETHSSLQVLHM